MATYRELHGKAVKTVTTNPSDDAAEGQIWFNSTDDTFKSIVALEAWTSASPMLNARNNPAGQGGTQNASWICGGNPPAFTATEEFNGTGWSSSGNLNNGRLYGNGAGTQTAAITIAGDNPTSPPNNGATIVEEYNGSSWTAGTAIPEGRYGHATCGAVKTAVIAVAGDQNTPLLSTTKEWNGSSWSEGGAYPAATFLFNGTGTSTAGLCATGSTPPQVNTVATYDGSSWTTTTNYPSTNQRVGMAGAQTSALCFGGSNSSTNTSFKFDGSTFTATPNMATSGGAFGLNGSSPQTTTLTSFGPGTTEEFNQSATVITAGAWAAGGALNTARYENAGTGSQTAGLTSGGGEPSFSNKTEEYDGSSWSNVTAYPISTRGMGAAGTQTSAVFWGGDSPPGDTITTTNEYDGSSWTGGGALTYDITTGGTGGTGTQTAGLMIAGYHKPENSGVNYVQEYNGSSWSANPNAYPTATFSVVQTGVATAALAAGGGTPAPATPTNAFEYDGTSFSATGSLIEATENAGAGGIQTAAITFGKGNNSSPTFVQGYDGTSFSTRPSIATGRRSMASGKNASTAELTWMAGGYTTTVVANTEEFTGETTSLNVKTLTQS